MAAPPPSPRRHPVPTVPASGIAEGRIPPYTDRIRSRGLFPASSVRCVFRSQSIPLTTEVGPSGAPPGATASGELGTLAWRAVARVLRSTAIGTLDSLTSVLFPADCRVCNAPLPGFSRLPICPSCWNQLPEQTGILCARCGEALPLPSADHEALCRVCRSAQPPFRKAVAHGAYAGTLRTLLHLLKYDGMQPIAKRLGVLLASRILATADLPASLLVVPVPLHDAKRRQRGFNQAELLARAALTAMRRSRPRLRLTLAAGALRRQRSTESQAALSPHQRRANLRAAFFVPRPERVSGRHVLLIDDMYTTGSTARACASVLHRAGAESVWVATVARAQWEFVRERPGSAMTSPDASPEPELPMEEDFVFWEEGRTVQTAGTAR
jgi:ComF family protein